MTTKYVKELELMHALHSWKIVQNRLKTFKMDSQFFFTRHIKKSYHFFEQKSLCFKDNLVAVVR